MHQKEEKLKQLRNGERVCVEEIKIPENGDPDRDVRFTRKSNQDVGRPNPDLRACLSFSAENFHIT